MLKKFAFEGLGLFPFGITGNNNKNKRENTKGKGVEEEERKERVKKKSVDIHLCTCWIRIPNIIFYCYSHWNFYVFKLNLIKHAHTHGPWSSRGKVLKEAMKTCRKNKRKNLVRRDIRYAKCMYARSKQDFVYYLFVHVRGHVFSFSIWQATDIPNFS